jgi:hypothetical protein
MQGDMQGNPQGDLQGDPQGDLQGDLQGNLQSHLQGDLQHNRMLSHKLTPQDPETLPKSAWVEFLLHTRSYSEI